MKNNLGSKTWFVILMLIIFFPIGLWCMWKNEKFTKKTRTIISAIFLVLIVIEVSIPDEGLKENQQIVANSEVLAKEEKKIEEQKKIEEEKRLAEERRAKEEKERLAREEERRLEEERLASETNQSNTDTSVTTQNNVSYMVWVTETGSKYHSNNNCGNSQTATQTTLEDAQARGLEPCKRCN